MAKANPVVDPDAILTAGGGELLTNKDAVGGYVGIDEDNKVYARAIFPSSALAATVNALVPDVGEQMFKTDISQFTIGNNAQYGGVPINLNSQNCVFISADGTVAKNGQALADAVTEAGQRTPYGSALSATNMAFVLMGPGTYDITGLASGISLPNFVGLIGLCGSSLTTIATTTSKRITHTAQSVGVNIYSVLRGITFTTAATTDSVRFSFVGDASNFIYIDHEDLRFPGLTNSQACMSFGSMTGSTTPTLTGYAKNVKTTGRALYGGWTSGPTVGSFTCNVRFEDCQGGDFSFGASGSSIGSRDGVLTGTLAALINCKNTGTGASAFSAQVDCPMIGCDWGPAIQRVGSNAEFYRNRIREAVSGESIEHSSGVTCRLAFNMMAGTIGNNITNSIDDGTLDTAGNFSDAQIV